MLCASCSLNASVPCANPGEEARALQRQVITSLFQFFLIHELKSMLIILFRLVAPCSLRALKGQFFVLCFIRPEWHFEIRVEGF
jgi:hypothetical protein